MFTNKKTDYNSTETKLTDYDIKTLENKKEKLQIEFQAEKNKFSNKFSRFFQPSKKDFQNANELDAKQFFTNPPTPKMGCCTIF